MSHLSDLEKGLEDGLQLTKDPLVEMVDEENEKNRLGEDHRIPGESCDKSCDLKQISDDKTRDVDNYHHHLASKSESPDPDSISNHSTVAPPYTIFDGSDTFILIFVACAAAFFSSLSSPIYLPAMPILEKKMHVSTELINLTVVVYNLFQGLGPVVWGALADGYGRRPVYFGCLIVYIGACVGLALVNSYGVMMFLRCLQAAGIAATVSLGAGVVGDITTRTNRGKIMGIFQGWALLGGGFGPLIGGGLTEGLGWRSIFWFLVIASSCTLIAVYLFLSETRRSFVGNGTIYPEYWIHRSPWMRVSPRLRKRIHKDGGGDMDTLQPRTKPQYLSFLLILKEPDVLLILIAASLHYSAWFMLTTALASALADVYHFNSLQIGLGFISNGMGSIVGSFVSGIMMNFYYRKKLERYRQECLTKWRQEEMLKRDLEDESQVDDSTFELDESKFDIHGARLTLCLPMSVMLAVGIIVYGWTIQYEVQYVCPLVFTFFVSFGAISYLNFASTLLVDIYPEKAASAMSCVNFVRCIIAAGMIAAVDRMIQSLGQGGCFTLIGGICLLSNGCTMAVHRWGPQWVANRNAKKA
ncbi:Quinidine resistance protein 2 [Yarrowia sp. C11]|nr:Quinidine resistance protein 2 [Yarrowia sp. C11]KAG5364921.1 Quinidine resistance protein 2 [Yarrowia sp. E02]